MRVDTSLLQGISAANQTTQSSASLKSTGTTTSFSSALKSAAEKETTKAVPGQNYSEILTGSRAGMYINTGGGARDGEAFVLVKHDGREDHIYGTGANRKIVTVGSGSKSESTDSTSAKDSESKTSTSTGSDKTSAAERTKQVSGRGYADILNGTRSGMYLNTSGNRRDGDAFVLVKRDDREYHIYGTGKHREIFSVKDPSNKTASTDTTTDTTKTAATDTPATGTTPSGPLVTDNAS